MWWQHFRLWAPFLVSRETHSAASARLICQQTGIAALPDGRGRYWLAYLHPEAERRTSHA